MDTCTHPLRSTRRTVRRLLSAASAGRLAQEAGTGGCDDCTDTHDIVWHLEKVAGDSRRHLVLVRCAGCGSYYEIPSVGRSGIRRITGEQARRWYPLGARYGAPVAGSARACDPEAAPMRHLHLAG